MTDFHVEERTHRVEHRPRRRPHERALRQWSVASACALVLALGAVAAARPAAAIAPPQPSACSFSFGSESTQGAAGTLVYQFALRPSAPWQDCALAFACTASITTPAGTVPAGIDNDPATGTVPAVFRANRLPPIVSVGWGGYCTTVPQPVVLHVSSGAEATSFPLGTSESCASKGTEPSHLLFEQAYSQSSAVGLAPLNGSPGYRITNDFGYVSTEPGDPLNIMEPDSIAPVTGIAAAPTGDGAWLVAGNGGVFTYGSAAFHGSAGNLLLSAPVVGMAADPATGGYWLVAADGGVFSYGAPFYGSAGALPLASPIVGMAAAPGGNGYWLVAADGGVFSYGPGAPFYGSAGAIQLAAPISAMATAPGGYWLFGADGGVFSYGGAAFHGSAAGLPLAGPVDAAAATADGGGYWLLGADGGVFAYGDAPYEGSATP
jgi:hypothetical protein